jgi:hypothetical protein
MHGLCFWLPVPIRLLVGPGCRRGLSVLARVVSRRAHGSGTTPGPIRNSRLRSRQCGLPVASTRSAPELRFSKLDSRPVDASIYASPGTSRHPAQDSRSRWFATPFLWGSFIPDYTPVYPDDCACLRARLVKIRGRSTRRSFRTVRTWRENFPARNLDCCSNLKTALHRPISCLDAPPEVGEFVERNEFSPNDSYRRTRATGLGDQRLYRDGCRRMHRRLE